MPAKTKKFFEKVKILQLERKKYLDKIKIICTFKKTFKLLSNYVLKIRIPSGNPSRVLTKDGFVKGGIDRTMNISRLFGYERIANCIKKNKFKHIVLPKKYLYHVPGRPWELADENYMVIAERIAGIELDKYMDICKKKKQKCRFTQEVANEVFTCVWESIIFNPDHKNILFTKNGKFAFIDTECLLDGMPNWHKTLWRAWAFHMARYSYPSSITNPYIVSGRLTKQMVADAMSKQRRALSGANERHRLKMPFKKGVTLFN